MFHCRKGFCSPNSHISPELIESHLPPKKQVTWTEVEARGRKCEEGEANRARMSERSEKRERREREVMKGREGKGSEGAGRGEV